MPDQPHLVATGVGTVAGTPDHCVLRAKLNVMADTAADAVARCAAVATQAVDALREHGVDPSDVSTTSLSVQDFFDKEERRVTARVASYQLKVTIGRLDGVGDVLGALSDVAGDSLQVQGLQLAVRDTGPLRSEARRRAVLDGRRTAEELADAAGVRLGLLLSINSGSDAGRQVHLRTGRSPTADVPLAMPVEPGEITLSCAVVLTYAIDR